MSSQAFKPRRNEAGVSTDVEELRKADGLATTVDIPTLRNVFAVLRIAISDVEALKFTVAHKPVRRSFLKLEPSNPYHAEIGGKLKGKPIEKLVQQASFAIPIDPADEQRIRAEWDRAMGISQA